MEDKSVGGARIRVKAPIATGSQLKIRWRFEQFEGIAKYCRREGREFVVGIQRQDGNDAAKSDGIEAADARANSSGKSAHASDDIDEQVADARVLPRLSGSGQRNPAVGHRALAEVQKEIQKEVEKRVEANPLLQSVSLMQLPLPQTIRPEGDGKEATGQQFSRRQVSRQGRPRNSGREELAVSRHSKLREDELSAQNTPGRERKSMARKWLGLAPWNNKRDDSSISEKDASEKENSATEESPNQDESRNSPSAKENRMLLSQSAVSTEKIATITAREVPAFQVELLPMEDIYRTAGIVSPRKGYSVTKVVEMLNSEHIRGLSKETKRAALLMALDAAGVTIEQVQRDAKSRQSALDSYESEQKKQAEAEWARKAEEISHIQAELESIKAHYTARISRNMEALARDKARFNSWVTTKEQEAQSMAEAVELCLKTPISEPATAREREISAASAGSVAAVAAAKPM